MLVVDTRGSSPRRLVCSFMRPVDVTVTQLHAFLASLAAN
jgi:hypothetical protein